jgi:hypothetical protein
VTAVLPQFCVSPRMQDGAADPACPEPSVLRFLPAQSQVTGLTPLGTTHVIQCWPQQPVAPPPHPVYLILLYRPDGVWLSCAPFPSFKTAAGQLSHKCPARVNGCPALSCSWPAHHLAPPNLLQDSCPAAALWSLLPLWMCSKDSCPRRVLQVSFKQLQDSG